MFHFNGNQIACKAVGVEFDEFRSCFPADERAFGFVRVQVSGSFTFYWLRNDSDGVGQSGDEMSKRTKFLFVTWLGPNVSTMKRARLSSDKALVKEIIMV